MDKVSSDANAMYIQNNNYVLTYMRVRFCRLPISSIVQNSFPKVKLVVLFKPVIKFSYLIKKIK